jgi:predicted transcriptional regulator of viral defense system
MAPLVLSSNDYKKIAMPRIKRNGKQKEKILEAFKKSNKPLAPIEVANLAGVNRNTARWCCLRLHFEGELERVKRGYYRFKQSLDP